MCKFGRFLCLQKILPFVVVLLIFEKRSQADMKVKLSCFGEDFKLECPAMNVLVIHLTSLSIPPENSSLCKNENPYAVPCDLLIYSDSLRTACSGKRSCKLGKNVKTTTDKCNTRFVVTVLYECKQIHVNATTRALLTSAKTSIRQTFEISSTLKTVATNEYNVTTKSETRTEVGQVTCLFYTLFSATIALQYMQGRPKHVILCIVLSVSVGTVLLIIIFLAMACIERIIEEREKKRKENAPVEISLPLLVTPGNEQQNVMQVDSAAQSDSGSGQREATLPRMQAVRRSHSVDEGTQTEPELDEACSIDNGLSDNEAKELGYLVDIMRYYNSNLENMCNSDEPLSLRVESQPASPYSSRQRTELSYTGPRIVDTSRKRQPRLSTATYSSSNNSENGDATMYLQTPSVKHNHINATTPRISTLPRRKPNLVQKYDAHGHTTNSLNHQSTPKLQNGPRRNVTRTRFADEISNVTAAKPYETFS